MAERRARKFVLQVDLTVQDGDDPLDENEEEEIVTDALEYVPEPRNGDVVIFENTEYIYMFYNEMFNRFRPNEERLPAHFSFPHYPLRFFENIPEFNINGYGIVTDIDWNTLIPSMTESNIADVEYFSVFREVPEVDDANGGDILKGHFYHNGQKYMVYVFSTNPGTRDRIYNSHSFNYLNLMTEIVHDNYGYYMVQGDSHSIRVRI